MLQGNTSLAAMAEELSRSTDYRVLRRLVPRTTFAPSVSESTKTGILLDMETTGLDPRKEEVIELGMVKFDYLPDARVAGVRDRTNRAQKVKRLWAERSPVAPLGASQGRSRTRFDVLHKLISQKECDYAKDFERMGGVLSGRRKD